MQFIIFIFIMLEILAFSAISHFVLIANVLPRLIYCLCNKNRNNYNGISDVLNMRLALGLVDKKPFYNSVTAKCSW